MTQPAADDLAPPEVPPSPATDRRAPLVLLAGVVALVVPLRAATGPIRDIDYYWHLLVGADILAGVPVRDAGRGWSFAPVPDGWVSTQWLAETLLAWGEQVGGLQSAVVYRTVTTILVLLTLGWATLWRRPVRAGVWLFALGAAELSIFAQERSQQLTYVLAPVLGVWLERAWRQGRVPRWWVVVPLVLVWAQFHGGWVLLPLTLLVAAVARAVDAGWRDRAVPRLVGLAVLSGAVACVSPAGLDTLTSVRRFSGATAAIIEWQPAYLWRLETLPLAVLLVVVVVAWARGRARPSAGELLVVLGLVAFALAAWRNVPTTVLILAPVLTGTLARALGEADPVAPGTPVRLRRTAIGMAVAGGVLGLAISVVGSPVVDPVVPQRLLATVATAPAQRVLNSYNIAGPLLWFGGRPPHVTVGIDGRADRYGGDYIGDYLDLLDAQPGWSTLFDRLAPTAALLRTDEALSEVLVAQRGWVEVGREGDYVLLRAPGSTGWPAS